MEDLEQSILKAVSYVKSFISFRPDIAIVLGGELGSLAYEVQNPIEVPFEDIPYFQTSESLGRGGKLIFGKIYNKNVVVMQGGLHYFEGYSMQEITFPIRIFAFLGVEALIITNSAGGINPKFKPGDIALITDHINLVFDSPLKGPNSSLLGARFPSMKNCYSPKLIEIAKKVSQEIGFSVQEGVYAYMPGPQYETDAEIKMLNTLGASIVGMSMVPEVIVATQSGMNVLGISCITHVADVYGEPTSHNEVLDVASSTEEKFKALVMDTINKIEIETEG